MAEDSSSEGLGTGRSTAIPEGTSPADTLASDFKPPELAENRSRLFRLWSLVTVAQDTDALQEAGLSPPPLYRWELRHREGK